MSARLGTGGAGNVQGADSGAEPPLLKGTPNDEGSTTRTTKLLLASPACARVRTTARGPCRATNVTLAQQADGGTAHEDAFEQANAQPAVDTRSQEHLCANDGHGRGAPVRSNMAPGGGQSCRRAQLAATASLGLLKDRR